MDLDNIANPFGKAPTHHIDLKVHLTGLVKEGQLPCSHLKNTHDPSQILPPLLLHR